jgi:hypothetical protein
MKQIQVAIMGIVTAATLSVSLPTQAALSFDQNVTANAIFGTGNGNGSFTVIQQNGVELGLRAKVRYAGDYNSLGNGTYTHQLGIVNGGATWNFEWSINSDYLGTSGVDLNDLTYLLRIDSDPTAGTSFTSFDPINGVNPNPPGTLVYWDHSIGDNTTGQSLGVEAPNNDTAAYAALISNNNLAQNSWRANWFGIDPDAFGTYTFQLEAFNGVTSLGMTEMTVNVVPEPSTCVAGALLLLPFGVSTLRMLRKKRTA